ncbi:MAG: nicotinate-nicotinamide nucleotide adenylyltransferase, partial [Christensenellales bacterium]
ILVPTGDAYKKMDLISAKHRFKMLQILVANDNDIEVSNFEMQKEQVFTYQTMLYFKNNYKDDEIVLICGLDNLLQIQSWQNYNEILQNYKIIVISRDGFCDISCKDYIDSLNGNIIVSNVPKMNISSTKIREILKSDKKLLKNCNIIDENVLNYIESENLY